MDTDHKSYMSDVLGRLLSSQNSKVIPEEKYGEIVRQLQHEAAPTATSSTDNPKLRWWIKRKRFQLVNFPELDLADVLVIPKKGEFKTLLVIY